MKCDFSRVLVDLSGNPIRTGEHKDLTLRTLAAATLIAQNKDEGHVTPEQKVYRYQLAKKVMDDETDEFDVEELALIKKLILMQDSILIGGQAAVMIESA